MSKYHLSPTGPKLCTANIKVCKYGTGEGTHFVTLNDALKSYSEILEKENPTVVTLKKTKVEKQLAETKPTPDFLKKDWDNMSRAERIARNLHMTFKPEVLEPFYSSSDKSVRLNFLKEKFAVNSQNIDEVDKLLRSIR